jgi:hypothetical protein
MHQGWPKLAANLWMATADQGLAAVTYGPSEVHTTVKGGTPVTIVEATEYPFREAVSLSLKLQGRAAFPLVMRIPAWAQGATVAVNGEAIPLVKPGEFLRLEREWKNGDQVQLRFPMIVRKSTWYNNSVAVERGPLVYSLKIGESWRKLKQTGPAMDWEVFPTTPWNYALVVSTDDFAKSFEVREKPMGKQPFSQEGAPVEIQAQGRRLPEWTMVENSAGPLPVSPVRSTRPEETLTLIPYGAAKLRVTAFPFTLPAAKAAAER